MHLNWLPDLSDAEVADLAEQAVTLVNPCGSSDTLLVCEHASNEIPKPWGMLGLSEGVLKQHIAWDIGAAALTYSLSELLDAPAILAGFSRLFIDANRALDVHGLSHGNAIPEYSDGIPIPGNMGLCSFARALREKIAYRPFHDAVGTFLDGTKGVRRPLRLLNIHSFTPQIQGVSRPWQLGVLWQRDARLALPLMELLRRNTTINIGDNQPYSAKIHHGQIFECYGEKRGLPYVVLELRNNEIDSQDKIQHMSKVISTHWKSLP